MADIKLSDLTDYEKSTLKQEVDGDNAGCGVIYTGKYYVSIYHPLKDPKTYKCNGVTIVIRKIENNRDAVYYPPIEVPYRQGFFTSNKEPFKNRLANAINKQTNLVIKLDKQIDDEIERIAKEKLAREKAIKDHTEKIRSCQLKIDSTIKTLVPNAKSMIEIQHDHLLAETTDNYISDTPMNEIVSKAFPEIGSKQKMYHDYNPNKKYDTVKEREEAVNDAILHSNDIPHREKREKLITMINEPELIMPGDSNYLTSAERNNKINTV